MLETGEQGHREFVVVVEGCLEYTYQGVFTTDRSAERLVSVVDGIDKAVL